MPLPQFIPPSGPTLALSRGDAWPREPTEEDGQLVGISESGQVRVATLRARRPYLTLHFDGDTALPDADYLALTAFMAASVNYTAVPFTYVDTDGTSYTVRYWAGLPFRQTTPYLWQGTLTLRREDVSIPSSEEEVIFIADAKADDSTKGIATFNSGEFVDDGAGLISLAAGIGVPADAQADGATKGIATFAPTDFTDDGAGLISLDYANGQAASGTQPGYLSAADWLVFNAKVGAARLLSTTAPLTGGGDLSQDRTLSISAATTDAPGAVELATEAEVLAEADAQRVVTPATLAAWAASAVISGLTWEAVTGTTQAMATKHGYLADNAALVTLTLPPTAALGDTVEVVGRGAGGWALAQGAGQQIVFGTVETTPGVTGGLASTHARDAVSLRCVAADASEWQVVGSQGNIAYN